MLLVLFSIGEQRFGLDTENFVEIIPSLTLTPLPEAPDYIPGFFDYRGTIVPVIDLTSLLNNTPSEKRLSTRIILIEIELKENTKSIVGLLGERMIETLEVNDEDLEDTGVASETAQHLGPMIRTHSGYVQCIALDKLIDSKLKSVLTSKEHGPPQ